MSEDIATLGIKIDASEVTPAAAQLDVLTAAGVKAEATFGDLAKAQASYVAIMQAGLVPSNALIAAIGGQAAANDLLAAAQSKTATGLAALASGQAGVASATGLATAALVTQVDTLNATNAAVGLTDVAFKSASASASVFALSLEGVAAIEASTAIVVVEANTSMAASLGALGSSAVRTAALQVEGEEAAAAASVESATVQVAAHGAVGASSLQVRESLVLLREAARGNWTRFGGSITILAGAFGLLETVLIPVAAVLGAVAAGFAVAENQINQHPIDLTQGFGLDDTQIARLTEKFGDATAIHVTFWDTVKATFQVGWNDIGTKDSEGMGKLEAGWNWYVGVVETYYEDLIGGTIGVVRAVAEAWKSMPTWLGGEGATFSLSAIESAFTSGITDTKKRVDDFTASVTKAAQAMAIADALKVAGKAGPADSAVSGAEKKIQELNDQTAAQTKLNDALRDGSMTLGQVVQQEKDDSALKSTIAKIELDTKLTLDQKRELIDQLTAAQQRNNAATQTASVLADTAKAQQNIQDLKDQYKWLGENNQQIAENIAQTKALQYLEDHPELSDKDAKAYLQAKINEASATVLLSQATKDYNNQLSETAALLNELASNSQNIASGMADAFGAVGTAIGGMSNALTTYAAKQADFATQQKKLNDEGNTDTAAQIILTQKQSDAEDQYYSDALTSLKGFFDSKSSAYKLLNAAEGVYNTLRLVGNLEAMASDTAAAATHAAAGATTVAVDATTTASGTASGAARIFAELGPWGFPVVAAMLAVMLGLGFGGGSGSAAAPDTTAKDTQATNGAGTVLGDATAKSDSIAQSLSDLAKDTNTDLEYSNQMVLSLKAIQTSIGSLTSLLAQQLQVGGLLNTASLGLGTTGGGGGILGSLFGSSKTTTTLIDQGITVGATTIGNAIANGIMASAYQTVQSTKTSSALFGLISSTSTSNNTSKTALPSDFTDQIQGIVGSLRTTVLDAATKLGIQGAGAVIDSMNVNLGNISFKDMTGTQIQTALTQVFGALGDDIAAAAVPQIKTLEQVGEGALQTLSRLVQEYTSVDDAMASMGKTFATTGVDSLAARDALVQASGGLDQFTSQAQFFVTNFLSSSAALIPVQKAVNDNLASLGITGLTTKNQFAQLVQGIDVSTASGAALYSALMMVAPAFAKVADASTALSNQQQNLQVTLLQAQGNTAAATALQRQIALAALDSSLQPLQELIYATQDLSAAQAALTAAETPAVTAANDLANAHTALTAAYNAQKTTLSATVTQFTGFATSLSAFGASLAVSGGPSSILTQYAQTKALFQQTATAAQGGDPTALGNLQTVSQNFLTASQAASATSSQYMADIAAVKSAVALSATQAAAVANTAQLQLTALDESVKGLGVLNDSVLSVADAINNLAIAQNASDQVQAAAIAKAQDDLAAAQAAQATALAAQAAAQQAATVQVAQTAYNSAANNVNQLMAARDALVSALGPQTDAYVQQNIPADQMGGYMNYYTYQDTPAGNAAVLLAQAANQAYVDAFNQAYSLYQDIPGHATGLNRVPHDNYLMRAHKDEAVLTSSEADKWRGNKASNDNSALIAEVKALRADMNASAKDTKKIKDLFLRVAKDGSSVLTSAA